MNTTANHDGTAMMHGRYTPAYGVLDMIGDYISTTLSKIKGGIDDFFKDIEYDRQSMECERRWEEYGREFANIKNCEQYELHKPEGLAAKLA